MSKITEVAIFIFIFVAFCPTLAAQNNPVPFLNNPTVPAAIAPGGPAFTLTVNGTGFANGAVILWNGSARATTFVNGTQLTAAILATDIATASLVFVTVLNPAPGGGYSNSVLFSVAIPSTSLSYTSSIIQGGPLNSLNILDPTDLVTAFDPYSERSVLAYSNASCPFVAGCTLNRGAIVVGGEGRGLDVAPLTIAAGDFNADGILDFVTLGNGSGTDNPPLAAGLYATVDLGGPPPTGILGTTTPRTALPSGASILPKPVVGDFNRDSHLDLVTGGKSAIYFFPGSGDGTFGTAISTITESGVEGGLVAGDFNGDGILDLAVTNPLLNTVSILIGNGDGTFQSAVDYATGTDPTTVVTSDFNADGKLDLAVLDGSGATVSILKGNGDGTFKTHVEYPAALSGTSLAFGDYNGDGIPDIAVLDTQCTSGSCATSGSVNILIGNGDGTFQGQLDFAAEASPTQLATTSLPLNGSSPTGMAQIAVISYSQSTLSLLTPVISQSGGNPVPAAISISPAHAIAGSGSFTLTVNGNNFVLVSTVTFGGVAEPTSFVNASQLTAAIPSSAITTVGSVLLSVSSPAPGGGTSNALSFSVLLPPPAISSLVPASVVAGSPGFTLAVNGTNFVNGSTVNINGASRTTAFVSPTQVSTSILSSDVVNVATINISVTNPVGVGSSTGGTSPSSPLAVVSANSQPTVGTLSPPSTTAGAGAFTLTISGSGFSPSSVVTFGSLTAGTVYQSLAELQATIPASAVAVAGTPLVTVANPGSSPSEAATFTVNNPVPTEFGFTPTSAIVGSVGFTLSVSGVEFNSSSIVQVNGKGRTTTIVSGGLVQTSLLAADLAQTGPLNISVSNPAPGGGISNVFPFPVNNPVPMMSSLAPTSALVGSTPFTMDVNGSNFNSSSTVQVNGQSRTTTFVSTLLLQVNILAADLATGGTLNILVNNPAPGGGSTSARQFAVTDYTITVPTSSATATVTAGTPATYTLTIASSNGTYSKPVTLSVTSSTLPPDATPSFSPSATITPGAVSQYVTLSIATTPHTLSSVHHFPNGNRTEWFLLSIAGIAFALAVLALRTTDRRMQRLAPQLLWVLLLMSVAGLAACSAGANGGASTPQPNPATGTPAGNYTIMVTATSGALSHSTSVTLNVM